MTIVNSGIVNTCVYIDLFESLVFHSFGSMPRSGIAGSYGNSMFNILRSCQPIFLKKKKFIFQVGKKMWLRLGGIEIELIKISSW